MRNAKSLNPYTVLKLEPSTTKPKRATGPSPGAALPGPMMAGQDRKEIAMLEARSAYGYFGVAGGITGENPPKGFNCIERRMPYREYKSRYPECDTLHDYDKRTKTITVLIPMEYTKRPNFDNRYSMHDFYFTYAPVPPGFSDVYECCAKCYANALRNARRWARSEGRIITGDAPGHERQRQY